MKLKKVFYISVLLLCFLVPDTGLAAEPTYQMTEAELMQLEDIFSKLREKQTAQQVLLNQQEEQLMELNTQLEISQKEIETSKQSTEALQTSLQKANQSLKESAEEAKRKNDRLERQRDMWVAFAVIAVGAVIANR